VYGVAVMADVGRRRWWPLASALTTDRLRRMFVTAAGEMDGRAATSQLAATQLAATLAYTVACRVVAVVILEGRAWDPGLENLWVHCDSEGAIDWVGVVDPTLRVLPNDPACCGHLDRAPVPHGTATAVLAVTRREPGRAGGVGDVGNGRIGCCHHRHTGSGVGRLVAGQRNASGAGGAGRVGLLRPSGAWSASERVA